MLVLRKAKDKVNFPVATNEHQIYTVPKDKVNLQANQQNALLYRLTTYFPVATNEHWEDAKLRLCIYVYMSQTKGAQT